MAFSKITYFLLVTANPLSNSAAAIAVFKIINRLDILSDEISIYLPGFHVSQSRDKDSEEEVGEQIRILQEHNSQSENEDYHGKNPIFHTYVESHGDIYFNDVDFAKFMRDLENICPTFDYCGETQLLILPTQKGDILADNIASFVLDELIQDEGVNYSDVEKFILFVLKLIRKDEDRRSLKLIPKIQELYSKLYKSKVKDNTSNVVVRLDNQLLEYMKWKERDEIFFVSYSTKDEFNAYAFKALLEKQGKNVWMAPDGIPAGLDYACAIPAALRITTRVVVLLSHSSAQSAWVRKELGKAVSNKKRLDGVFLDGFTFEDMKQYDHMDFLLENVQLRYSIQDLFEDREVLDRFLIM